MTLLDLAAKLPKPIRQAVEGDSLKFGIKRFQLANQLANSLRRSPRHRLFLRMKSFCLLFKVSLGHRAHLRKNSARAELLNFVLDATELATQPAGYWVLAHDFSPVYSRQATFTPLTRNPQSPFQRLVMKSVYTPPGDTLSMRWYSP
ncbi:hypothetical protein ALP99_200031 [Pseudomonas syringae pv. tomato]|nr:hypothetical protein PST407_05755 [Pseudomonas syringae pv. tomato]KUR46735.1 hypothetical protein PSTA9_02037 [Pseudomonas syringae pv. tomato]RMQ62138.1 hypothetical protein ALQ00_200014 [Pseudomonas syringae pv. tomato]RMQ67019.1 hypothetical protein ALP99_200031 [Pseudomonas syringae pv. tomato]